MIAKKKINKSNLSWERWSIRWKCIWRSFTNCKMNASWKVDTKVLVDDVLETVNLSQKQKNCTLLILMKYLAIDSLIMKEGRRDLWDNIQEILKKLSTQTEQKVKKEKNKEKEICTQIDKERLTVKGRFSLK